MKLSEATILVVDDEPDLLDIFEQWLKIAGCTNVLTAANGEEALAVARAAGSLNLLITDVHMPIMDGISLVRQLGEIDASIPSIIFVSGFGDIGAREMYALGVGAFLSKPLQYKDFIGTVEKALAERCDLWLTPMDVPPRQSMCIEATGIGETREAKENHFIQLGKGGFSTHYDGSLAIGKISFQCSFPSLQKEMLGEGYVRWRSRTDATCGIEFAHLDPACRFWLLEAITAAAPRSFIPGL